MSALRKAQHNLFDAGPAACMTPQPEAPRKSAPFVHLCACGRWGDFGVGVLRGVPGTWFCAEHLPVEHRPRV